jgi:predicted RNase H-like HicB family nuclease
MKYKLPVTINKIDSTTYMAQSDPVRATATGDTPERALANLQDAINELIKEYGEKAVFQDVSEVKVCMIEVGQ